MQFDSLPLPTLVLIAVGTTFLLIKSKYEPRKLVVVLYAAILVAAILGIIDHLFIAD